MLPEDKNVLNAVPDTPAWRVTVPVKMENIMAANIIFLESICGKFVIVHDSTYGLLGTDCFCANSIVVPEKLNEIGKKCKIKIVIIAPIKTVPVKTKTIILIVRPVSRGGPRFAIMKKTATIQCCSGFSCR